MFRQLADGKEQCRGIARAGQKLQREIDAVNSPAGAVMQLPTYANISKQ
jgi:hypothetical protein